MKKKPKKVAKPVKKTPKKVAKKTAKIQKKTPKKVAKKSVPKKVIKKPVKKTKRQQRVAEFAQSLITKQVLEEKKQIKPYPVLQGGHSTRATMLIPLLRDLVKKKIISDWLINVGHHRNANIYVERNFTIEDELLSVREDVLLTIYERFPDGTIGEAKLPIITTDPEEAKQQILDAKETCSYARKKEFMLPDPIEDIVFPQSFDERMLHESFSGNGMHVPQQIYQRVKTILSPIADVKTNSFEILTSAGTIRVINSNGVDISYHKTSIYFEAVLTCKGESEFVLIRAAVSPEQLDIESLLLQQVQIARDAAIAKPNPGFSGDVVISGQSVTEVFASLTELNPLMLHTSAKMAHMGISSLKIGQQIGNFTGETLTLTSNPALPLGLLTAPIDDEGTPLRPVELIRNGIFTSYMATSRYAQYLHVPVTGNFSNIQINAGATREQHLRGNNYFEVASFSWFHPNPITGDFAAEIRLGYHWVNGKKFPFHGGAFSGNLFKNILHVRFSKEITQSGYYYGPRTILFKNAHISKL